MVAVDGRLEPEAGQSLLAALEPLARPAPPMRVVGASVGPTPWPSWPAGPWRGAAASDRRGPAPADRHRGPGQPAGPHPAGWRHRHRRPGCGGGRRLACDGAVTRVLVTRQPTSPGPGVHLDDRGGHHRHHDLGGHQGKGDACGHLGRDHPGGDGHPGPHSQARLTDQLQTAAALLPPVLGGDPTQPLEVGRTTRVVQPGQRLAWPCATAAASSLAATGPLPGVRPIICGTGGMAAPPTWATWSCCAGLIIGPSMRRLAADPPARRAADRHPTPPTPPTTTQRRLTGGKNTDLQVADEPYLGRAHRPGGHERSNGSRAGGSDADHGLVAGGGSARLPQLIGNPKGPTSPGPPVERSPTASWARRLSTPSPSRSLQLPRAPMLRGDDTTATAATGRDRRRAAAPCRLPA